MKAPRPLGCAFSFVRCLPLAPLVTLLLFPAALWARNSDTATADTPAPDTVNVEPVWGLPRGFGPPPRTPGIPPDAELMGAHAVVGEILIDNQDIFDLSNPKDNYALFRLANNLHIKTKEDVIRHQLLFKSGEPYSPRLIEESERILRANDYFYDAWIRIVSYHDGKVDLRVTTKDVWTLNPGFNYGRSGGKNTVGVQLEEINFLGRGAALQVAAYTDVDRTVKYVAFSDAHIFGTWTAVNLKIGTASDGFVREFSVVQPFYALDAHRAAGVSGVDDLQTDSLYNQGQIIDQFSDAHKNLEVYAGWSPGLSGGWVRRWSTGFTYDQHVFGPVASWSGPPVIPPDRRFIYPWLEFDIKADDYLKLYNHDQIARTEDFYLGTTASVRVGAASASMGSSQSAIIFHSVARRGFRGDGGTATLLVGGDFSGRLERGILYNGLLNGSVRYYNELTSHWLFFTSLQGSKGWRLDLDNQILLGGDNGLRGYPLRYQAGDARALWTVEQRYFTDWFIFRLFRVGAAIFVDTGRTWGTVPPATPPLGLLTDAGMGLRFGNARSGLGNVIHVDVAFPFNTQSSVTTIKSVQFLVTTQQSF